MAYGGWTGQFTLPPIGADDNKAASVVQQLWGAWQQIRRPWLREVEENVRMLSGRQYDEYIPELGRFEDISQYWMSGDEAWRQQPVFNWIGQVWFPSMLGKLTENVNLSATNTNFNANTTLTDKQRDAALEELLAFAEKCKT